MLASLPSFGPTSAKKKSPSKSEGHFVEETRAKFLLEAQNLRFLFERKPKMEPIFS